MVRKTVSKEDLEALLGLLGAESLVIAEVGPEGALRPVAVYGRDVPLSPRLAREARRGPVFRETRPEDRTAYTAGARAVMAVWLTENRIAYVFWGDAALVPEDERAVTAFVRLAAEASAPPPGMPPALVGAGLPPGTAVEMTPLGPLVYRSERFRRVVEDLRLVAETSDPVLLIGETGAGKTLLAAALHEWSGRPGAFVHDSAAAAVGRDLFRTRLFGARAGAWTDLREDVFGLIEAARRGTLFIDEIAEADPADQAALLACIETGRYFRIGETAPRTADVRWVFATNRPEGIRPDLLNRCAYGLRVPPLRERPEDVEPLAVLAAGLPLAPGLARALEREAWPGNVRELMGLMRTAGRLAAAAGAQAVDARHVEAARRLRAHLGDDTPEAEAETGRLARAVEWLRTFLGGGPKPARELLAAAVGAGIAARTLERARKVLGVEARKEGNVWMCYLPDAGKPASP